MKGCVGWIVALGLVLGILYFWFTRPLEDLRVAATRGQVDLAVVAGGANSATLTITRRDGVTGRLMFRLPAGTVIASDDSHTQRLITAKAVVVSLDASQTTTQQQIETYCLDQFKVPPVATTPLRIDLGSAGDSGEGVSEISKLADCLEGTSGSARDRQVAIWLVKEGFIEKNYDQARSEAIDSLATELGTEMRRKISTELRARLRQADPSITEEEIRRQEARFSPGKLSARVHGEAERLIDASFANVRGGVDPILKKCAYDTASLAFFQTAPS
ncbi:MAG: hypothetical protein JWN66_2190 [Sphingomonas bacterium]|uniref:hypothetical protein n=1 Tax=Sphingomonas bacterium TaxID=1895847 RepID=UPI002632C5F6|nr:hypothetical protein [Sphingomonas bacterium]MDB5705074.1 hypothetical protein [Sphingomonas bacterium]